MDQLPPDPAVQPPSPGGDSPAPDLVAAQIKRQLQDEPQPAGPTRPAASDPGHAFHMQMRGGGNELTDSAEQFKAEHGAEAYQPPEFSEGGWEGPAAGSSGGMMKVVVAGLVVVLLGVAIWQWGWPAWQAYQARQATGGTAADGAATAGGTKGAATGLEAVTLDDAFDADLRQALTAGNAAWKGKGLDAKVYRYGVQEDKIENSSQTITVVATLAGQDATKAIGDDRPAFDAAVDSFIQKQTAHPGVNCKFNLMPADPDSSPDPTDKYLSYGGDYGREHLTQVQPILDALEQLKRDQGSYPRSLDPDLVQPKIHTTGGIKFSAHGIGYLPLFRTDSGGNLVMGTGGTLDRMSPAAVDGYFLFLYLGDAGQGLDVFGPAGVDYFTRKLAPLPYDTGGAKLHNMPLSPDGQPDGIGAVIKSGKVLDGATK
jgi:hypothetical protein